MIRSLNKFIFLNLLGWEVTGVVPDDKKIVAIVAPHTSWHDFFVGVFTRSVLKMENRIKFLGKYELFKNPLIGWFLRKLGGYPVVRNKQVNSVDSVVNIFNDNENFFLTLAPEGTRAKVNSLKTGFYYIALKAKVPILMVGFCFKRRIVHLGKKFYPTGNIDKDMKKIIHFFSNYQGKVPNKGLNHLV